MKCEAFTGSSTSIILSLFDTTNIKVRDVVFVVLDIHKNVQETSIVQLDNVILKDSLLFFVFLF
jgi:hypothetical protein